MKSRPDPGILFLISAAGLLDFAVWMGHVERHRKTRGNLLSHVLVMFGPSYGKHYGKNSPKAL